MAGLRDRCRVMGVPTPHFEEAEMFAWHDTPWMWLSMIVFWSLFVLFFYYLLKERKASATQAPGVRTSEILQERFARGDISAEEYRESRDLLDEPAGTPRGVG